MKSFFALLSLALIAAPTLSFASGGTHCKSSVVDLSVGQGHLIGSPLISDVFFSKNEKPLVTIPRDQVVNYWVESNALSIRATDADILEEIALVKITGLRDQGLEYVGKMDVKLQLPGGKSLNRKNIRVSCIFE